MGPADALEGEQRLPGRAGPADARADQGDPLLANHLWTGKYRDGMPAPEIKVFGPEWSNQQQPPGPRMTPDDIIPPRSTTGSARRRASPSSISAVQPAYRPDRH